MPREKISWTKIGLFSLGGSAALIGYLYYKRRYPKYEEIEPAPKIESLDKAKDELVKIILTLLIYKKLENKLNYIIIIIIKCIICICIF